MERFGIWVLLSSTKKKTEFDGWLFKLTNQVRVLITGPYTAPYPQPLPFLIKALLCDFFC